VGGERVKLRPELIDRVMRIADSEPDGDHFLSHFVLCHKVLRETAAQSILIARSFTHRRLTRDECQGMVSDWIEEGWGCV
jgi:hypothetical protein